MKRSVWTIILIFFLPFFSKGQAFETEQLLLDVQKLSQLRQMLADLKKGYEIVYKGYSTIKNISQGSFNLHQAFLGRRRVPWRADLNLMAQCGFSDPGCAAVAPSLMTLARRRTA